MPLPIIVKPPFPNIPALPGVPPLARNARFPPVVQAAVGFAEGLLWSALTKGPVWGVYDESNNPIALADSVVDFGYRNESKISTFPQQAGAFAAYNKVANPFEVTVQLAKGGSASERSDFLDALEAAAKSLDLYHVVTPERTYLSVNLERQGIRRTRTEGATLIVVELSFIEIRQVLGSYSAVQNAREPTAASPVDQGKVAPVTPPQSTLSKILGKSGA